MNKEIPILRDIRDKLQIRFLLTECADSMFNQSINRANTLEKLSEKYLNNGIVKAVYFGEVLAGIIAYYANDTESNTAYLSVIVIKKDFQSCGAGSFLMNHFLKDCASRGFSICRLEADSNNIGAIRFYEKFGFKHAGNAGSDSNYYTLHLCDDKQGGIIMSDREQKYAAFVRDDAENNRGRLVNCCDELAYLLAHPIESEIFSRHYLNQILTYATTFSPFYQRFRDFRSLREFPLTDKQFLKDHWDEICVEACQGLSDNCVKYTSGSTGTPFQMVMDRYKHCRWIAGNKVFRANVGVPSHERTVFVSDTVRDKNIPMERQERDNVYYLDCTYLDRGAIDEFIQYLMEHEIHTMTAMASVLDRIAKLTENQELPAWNGEFLAVFSVSETLKQHTRRVISEYFKCPVYVLYANEENGVLGVEDGSGLGCRANTADFFFEVLSMDSDDPAPEGELGRLVITDFFNMAFPVIRYENGDLVSIKKLDDGKCYFTEIAERKIDMLYASDGRMVHYFNGISFLEPFMDIRQFQLIQEDFHNFIWVLNTENHGYEEFITRESKALFGEDTNWTFQYVTEIPKLRSGKSRMTVCKIPEEQLRSIK